MSEIKILDQDNITLSSPFKTEKNNSVKIFLYELILEKDIQIYFFIPVYIGETIPIVTFKKSKRKKIREQKRILQYQSSHIISKNTFEQLIGEFKHFMKVVFELSEEEDSAPENTSTKQGFSHRKNYFFLPKYSIQLVESLESEMPHLFEHRIEGKHFIWKCKDSNRNYFQVTKLKNASKLKLKKLVHEWSSVCFRQMDYQNQREATDFLWKSLKIKINRKSITLSQYLEDVIPAIPVKTRNNFSLVKEIFEIYFELQNKKDLDDADFEPLSLTQKKNMKQVSIRAKMWAEDQLYLVYQLPQIQEREVNFRNEVKRFHKFRRGYHLGAYEESKLDHLRLHLFPKSAFDQTRVMSTHFEFLLELPSICYCLERALDIQEVSFLMNWNHVDRDFLCQAFQNSSFDPEINFETLETVGDSCLKLVVSLFFFDKNPNASEEKMTTQKVKLINNEYLGRCADQLGLQFYVRVFKNTNLRFKIPFLNYCKGAPNFRKTEKVDPSDQPKSAGGCQRSLHGRRDPEHF